MTALSPIEHHVNESAGSPPAETAVVRLEFLDAVRGLAASWVVTFHVYVAVAGTTMGGIMFLNMPAGIPGWAWFMRFGGTGVLLFFVVSAFSLCYTMQQYRDQSAIAFYVRRLFRIAPLFYALILLQLCLHPELLQLPMLLANTFFVFNMVPDFAGSIVLGGWTIGVEMLFYLLFPFLFRHVDNLWKAAVLLLVAVLIAWATTPLAAHHLNVPNNLYFALVFYNFPPVFAAGIVAFHASTILKRMRYAHILGLALIAAALIWLCLLFVTTDNSLLLTYDRTALIAQGIIHAMFIVGLMLAPTAIFVNRVTAFLGKLSYSIYLLHMPIIFSALLPVFAWIYTLPGNRSFHFAACLAVTFAIVVPVSYLTYRWIEEPGIQLGRTVWRRWSTRRALKVAA